MKELREYQQSEAYKMCTEKIQEKKIKKGGLWEQRLLGAPPGCGQALPEPPGGAGLAPRGDRPPPSQRMWARRQ